MPSLRHEAIVQLFRNRPSLAPELIRGPLCQPLPQYHDVEVREADLSQITPTEYRSDLVVLLRAGEPVYGIVVEVLLGRDEKKLYSWPLYQAALRARLRCPVCVLVVAPEPGVAEWARRPIETGQPGVTFVPLVLGAEGVPVVTDAEVARQHPELAVLSVQAHGRGEEAMRTAVAALEGIHDADGLEDERAMLYCDLVWLAIGESARRKLEELMERGTYTYQSDFAKKYFGEGRDKGKAEGKAEGKRESVLSVLEVRFGDVPEALVHAVNAVTDVELLSGLHREAVTVESLEAFEAVVRERAASVG